MVLPPARPGVHWAGLRLGKSREGACRVTTGPASMLQRRTPPFHERTSQLCLAQNWRRWAGYLVAGSYDLTLDREYWAIRNATALRDFTPLMKYLITGPARGGVQQSG